MKTTLQRNTRHHTPLLVTLFTAAAMATVSIGHANAAGVGQQVSFAIPPIAYATGTQHPGALTIGAQHVAQGYIDVADATSMLVSANVDEYLLTVKLDNPLIARAALRIGGSDYAVDSKLAVLVVAAQRARDIPVSVAWRLYLKPGARAGVYPWPLALAIAPRAI